MAALRYEDIWFDDDEVVDETATSDVDVSFTNPLEILILIEDEEELMNYSPTAATIFH